MNAFDKSIFSVPYIILSLSVTFKVLIILHTKATIIQMYLLHTVINVFLKICQCIEDTIIFPMASGLIKDKGKNNYLQFVEDCQRCIE